VQNTTGIDGGLSELKAIPITTSEETKITFRGNDPVFVSEHVKKQFYPLDPMKVIANPESEIAKVLKRFPKAKRFLIGANAFETRKAASPGKLLSIITKAIHQYESTFAEWFNGVYVFEFQNQKQYDEYRRDYEKAQEKKRRQRSNARRRKRG